MPFSKNKLASPRLSLKADGEWSVRSWGQADVADTQMPLAKSKMTQRPR